MTCLQIKGTPKKPTEPKGLGKARKGPNKQKQNKKLPRSMLMKTAEMPQKILNREIQLRRSSAASNLYWPRTRLHCAAEPTWQVGTHGQRVPEADHMTSQSCPCDLEQLAHVQGTGHRDAQQYHAETLSLWAASQTFRISCCLAQG